MYKKGDWVIHDWKKICRVSEDQHDEEMVNVNVYESCDDIYEDDVFVRHLEPCDFQELLLIKILELQKKVYEIENKQNDEFESIKSDIRSLERDI